jgi:hypothetical protein
MLSYNTFKSIINNLISLIEEERKFDEALEKTFGSDTQIVTSITSNFIENMIKTLEEDMNDNDGWIDYLIYESLLSPLVKKSEIYIFINGKQYEASIENIYKILEGTL